MATITAHANFSGSSMNVLSPETWIGGEVPGKGDIARLPDITPVYNRFSTGNGYLPWEGYSNYAAGVGKNNQFGTTTWYQQGIHCSDIQAGGLWGNNAGTVGKGNVAGGAIGTPGHSGSFYMPVDLRGGSSSPINAVKITFTGSYTGSNDYFLS